MIENKSIWSCDRQDRHGGERGRVFKDEHPTGSVPEGWTTIDGPDGQPQHLCPICSEEEVAVKLMTELSIEVRHGEHGLKRPRTMELLDVVYRLKRKASLYSDMLGDADRAFRLVVAARRVTASFEVLHRECYRDERVHPNCTLAELNAVVQELPWTGRPEEDPVGAAAEATPASAASTGSPRCPSAARRG